MLSVVKYNIAAQRVVYENFRATTTMVILIHSFFRMRKSRHLFLTLYFNGIFHSAHTDHKPQILF